MADMDEKEDENNENDKQSDREVDLGERNLDDENLLNEKEDEMAAGDNDK
jgi:hypothetical protein